MSERKWRLLATDKLGRRACHRAFRRYCEMLCRRGHVSRTPVTIDGTKHTLYAWFWENFAWEAIPDGDHEFALWELS